MDVARRALALRAATKLLCRWSYGPCIRSTQSGALPRIDGGPGEGTDPAPAHLHAGCGGTINRMRLPFRTSAIQAATAHRPWPLPRWPWIMFQSWRNLLFAHWPLPPDQVRTLVPRELEIDEFDGSAWVGLTPFRLTGLRARCLPPPPLFSEFPEMNLRTYVRVGGKPGIFFFTLEAASRLAVLGARMLYRLPYHRAQMQIGRESGWIRFRSRREADGAGVEARYRGTGPWFEAAPGSLEHFLIERYALYTVIAQGWVLRGEIHHRPWTIRVAEAEITRNTLAGAHGLALPDRPPLLHFCARQDTLVWPPEPVRISADRTRTPTASPRRRPAHAIGRGMARDKRAPR